MSIRSGYLVAVGLTLIVASVASCGDAKKGDDGASKPKAARDDTSSRPATSATSASSAAASASAAETAPSASAAQPEMTPEEAERANVGCKQRKSTNITSACTKADPTSKPAKLGEWSPSEDEVASVVAAASPCYCAEGVDALARACMQKAQTSLVTFTVGKEGDPTDCTVTVSSAESGGRHFVRLDAANRDQATFYATIAIDELVDGKRKGYFSGFNLVEEAEIKAGAEGVSKTLQNEWPSLPKALQGWILGQ